MSDTPSFDLASAHHHFATSCFNACWTILLQPSRTVEEDDRLVAMAQASFWHWLERPDCTPKNISIGYWLLSRVHAVVQRPAEVSYYARRCVELSRSDDVPPYFLGCAYEASARAASVAGDVEQAAQLVAFAREIAEALPNDTARQQLLDELATIEV